MIKEGKIVLAEVTIKLLLEPIQESDNDKFLIDGVLSNEKIIIFVVLAQKNSIMGFVTRNVNNVSLFLLVCFYLTLKSISVSL